MSWKEFNFKSPELHLDQEGRGDGGIAELRRLKNEGEFTVNICDTLSQDERASILRAAIKGISQFPCFWEIFNYSDVH